jgi:hypothetical protein
MKPTTLLSILLACCLGVAADAQEKPATDPPEASEASAEEPAVDPLLLLTQPGEHHAHLHRLVGDWDLTIRVWPTPDAEPIESAGTAEARWILGGRFLWTIYRAELFGKPFEAWSVEGYDNQARQYVGTWRDTQGTYTLNYLGTCQQPPVVEGEAPAEVPAVPDGTYRVMTTEVTDPVSGEVLQVRTELRVETDGGGFVQESFVVLSPEESVKNLELVGTRRGD